MKVLLLLSTLFGPSQFMQTDVLAPQGKTGILSRFGSHWVSPYIVNWQDGQETRYHWGVGTSFRLGFHNALQGRYTKGWEKGSVGRGELGWVVYF